jgi:hypothetical protein
MISAEYFYGLFVKLPEHKICILLSLGNPPQLTKETASSLMLQEKGGENRMTFKKQLIGLVLALALVPVAGFAQEKQGTISAYDKESRMVTVKGKDWEQKAKVSSGDAKDKGDLLKDGTKVKVVFDDRGGGDVRVKTIEGR